MSIFYSSCNALRLGNSAMIKRSFSASATNATKVAVLGAGGGIGQPLSLLLKLNPRVSNLALYDIRGSPGVATDISHIDTKSTVRFFFKYNLMKW